MPRLSFFTRILPHLWVVVAVCAFGFMGWVDWGRVQRVESISSLQGRARPRDIADRRSPTGYADGQRELIVPEASQESFQWIAQTQQMLATGEARVRHVAYENAPNGHEVSRPSPYRWWLGLLAWAHHTAFGTPIGISVERAALYSDPILHLLLFIGATLVAAIRFGRLSAAVLSAGVAAFYPFASGFLPGMPGEEGLAGACGLVAILLVLMGVDRLRSRREEGEGAARSVSVAWFALAGVAGGVGIWISAKTQVPLTAGIGAGALLSAWVGRRDPLGPAAAQRAFRAWRTWAYFGGATVLVAYFAEYFPSHMGYLGLDRVHPAHGLAWVCAGELLVLAVPRIWGEKGTWGPRQILIVALAAAGLCAVPAVVLWTGSWGFLVQDLSWARLCRLPGAALAESTAAWMRHDSVTLAMGATLLPLLAVVPAAWMVLSRSTGPRARATVAVALGPVIVAALFACWQLSWWGPFDAAILCLMVAACARRERPGSRLGAWSCALLAFSAATLGALQYRPQGGAGPERSLTSRESEGLIERHLAHWLSRRSGGEGSIVYAPPEVTPGLWFYGGLRGIGSPEADNRVGFGATLNIAAALTMEEAQNDLRARAVRYIVLPSWDPFFDEFARRYLDRRFASRPNFFVGELRRLNLPPWLRPIPYQMPVGGGFEGQSVMVFEVVGEQAPAVAASRTAEYLVEMGDLDRAATFGETLRRFPGDVGALSAGMEVQLARGESEAAGRTLEVLLRRLSAGGDRYLPWDRRVSLAIVLAQAGRIEQSRDQVSRCFKDANEDRIRSLTTGSLFNLLVIGGALRLEIADPGLRETARDLLPEDLRSRL
jgi:hypothetical protein